ncbi:bifunctional adenosylcobinamide kinase/adenosylcobinamide-phosphate guanylyltransferase [Lysobacteraceae bacterium NML120232]|nr:bifunctional adenosylcobinamide kinase/adenosylcobinamide-phosphate guanylyltransferase [Xanthomonadaceae bacterium NML08-0793]PJK13468.1 bifunctional adenosylcobinamide kinase/adenosylcobinamide-phosphate guanylyltransferase [Xanthomonadaceae bacterium NML120232]
MQRLILGGARSGKSAFAERLARQSGKPVTYIATAQALDAEMAARIAHHRQQRPPEWSLVEAPLALAEALQTHAQPEGMLLVDCLTLWLSNHLLAAPENLHASQDALLATLAKIPGEVILVSNEVGQGVVPMGALSRRFVDEAGRLHQRLAAHCDAVVMVVAGLAWHLKGKNDGT